MNLNKKIILISKILPLEKVFKKHLDNVQVVDPRIDMLEFHTDWGTVSANMSDEDMNNRVFNNWFLRVYDKSRNLLIEPDEAFRRETIKRGRLIQYRDIIRNYEKFKKNIHYMYAKFIYKLLYRHHYRQRSRNDRQH